VLAVGAMSVREDGNFDPTALVYASELDGAPVLDYLGPNTREMLQLDLVAGSIIALRNARDVMVFKQGETVLRTTRSDAMIRQI